MKKLSCSLVVPSYYYKNKAFDPLAISNTKYLELKNELEKRHVKVYTNDILDEKKADFSIHLDYNKPKSKKNYLIIIEPPIIIKENHNIKRLDEFDKVFTWNDDLVNDKNIYKYQLSHDFLFIENPRIKYPRGYCMIVSNKKSNKKNENYSFRKEIIKYYESSNERFDLFGNGWNKYKSSNKYLNFFLKNLKVKPPISFSGRVVNKHLVASKYEFQFAIENSKNINGYISEKLFDCFLSGNVPIYSGAKNILKYIPKETFIDLEKFDSLQKAHDFISSLDQKKIKQIKQNGHEFITGEKAMQFTPKYNAKLIAEIIINDL